MMILVHAKTGQIADSFPADLLNGNDFIALFGPPDAFDMWDLSQSAGQVDGPVLRVTYLQPRSSAFAVLADAARLFQRLLAERPGDLLYVQANGESPPEPGWAPVAWMTDGQGGVTAFRLASPVAASPLLIPLTRDLAACPMTDARRFDFLAAAFAGV